MAGGYYTALSGMQARMDKLDRLAADIANAGTAGYKTERTGTVQADRPTFDATLQSAIDVVNGETKVDRRAGALAPTGRSLDVAIDGSGFFVVNTDHGVRYTRNGHFMRRGDGVLANEDGEAIAGTKGDIKIGTGTVEVDADGTVRSGGAIAGQLNVVDFPPDTPLQREGASKFRIDGTPKTVDKPAVHAGSLEDSNVSVADRIAELSEVTRTFESLMKGVTILMNDVDRTAINELGKK